jgi:hypothetical protein
VKTVQCATCQQLIANSQKPFSAFIQQPPLFPNSPFIKNISVKILDFIF